MKFNFNPSAVGSAITSVSSLFSTNSILFTSTFAASSFSVFPVSVPPGAAVISFTHLSPTNSYPSYLSQLYVGSFLLLEPHKEPYNYE